VKSGGHTTNPRFSSTKGILIYTGKFSQVTYDPASGTAVVGSGLTWDVVYQRLQEHNAIVVGGRVPGVSGRHDSLGRAILNLITYQVGVGGLLLGGGWSPEFLRRFLR